MGRRRREGAQGGRGAPGPAPAGADIPLSPRPDPLSAEDRALWSRVAASVRPLDSRRTAPPAGPVRPAPDQGDAAKGSPPASDCPTDAARTAWPAQVGAGRTGPIAPPQLHGAPAGDAVWPPADFRIGAAARPGPPATIRLAPEPGQALRDHPLRMDHKTHRRMTQGRIAPEARIDLHGMTLGIAQPVLTRFVLDARARGLRLVLVITGKGRAGGPDAPLPVRPGALRHHVPHWLHMPPLAAIVLQVRPAHPRHGGEGAYYVWLRRADR